MPLNTVRTRISRGRALAAARESAARACQEEPAESGDDFVSAVFRGAFFREAIFREALFRATTSRPSLCVEVDGRERCAPSVAVPSRSVPSVAVPSRAVESASLPSYVVQGAPGTTVFTGGSGQSYVTPAEVLFDLDQSDIKPAAATSLDAYNRTLSEARAAAVAAWLTAERRDPGRVDHHRGPGRDRPRRVQRRARPAAPRTVRVATVTTP